LRQICIQGLNALGSPEVQLIWTGLQIGHVDIEGFEANFGDAEFATLLTLLDEFFVGHRA